jgi:UDP-4-amino-4,6-dideoxy-N-acetyl-beta-L-altrosamine N-acetyltransferase
MRQQPLKLFRTLEKDDLPTLLEWRNTDRIRQCMRNTHLITAEEHLTWWNKIHTDITRKALIFEVDRIAYGFMQFAQEDEKGKTLSWGFYTAPHAPRGTGRLMCEQAIYYAFEQLGCEVLRGQSIPDNLTSIRLHLALGFSQTTEGEEGMVNFELKKVKLEPSGVRENHSD